MSNVLWVKLKKPNNDGWSYDKIKNLPDDADVADLRDMFAERRSKGGIPTYAGTVDVFVKEGGKELDEDTDLANYFVVRDAEGKIEKGDEVNQRPGRSRATALVLIVSDIPEQHVSKRQRLFVEEKAFSPDLSAYNSDRLIELKVFKRDDYILVDPYHGDAFVGREVEKTFIREKLLTLAKATTNDKKHKFVVECATMSGAGKSRLMFNIFRDMKLKNGVGEDLPVHVIRANFNGADGGRDLALIEGKDVKPYKAACRLLLTRGILRCSPDAGCLGGLEVVDKNLPEAVEIKNAIFGSTFGGSNGKGIVIVHLDELGCLIEAREGHDDEDSRKNALKWVKEYMYAIVALSDPARDRILVPVITHTSPLSRIFQSEKLSMAEVIPWKLHPFSLIWLWTIHDQNRELNNLEPVSEDIKKAWSACAALTGGNPQLFLIAFPYNRDIPGYNTATVHTVIQNLLDNHRVKEPKWNVTSALAKEFLLDVFRMATVPEDKHKIIEDQGIAWFVPKTTVGRRDMGLVSSPFPYLMKLMERAGGVFADVALQLDPTEAQYEPAKAMEYVAALAFLVNRVGSVEDWIGRDISVRRKTQALDAIKSEVNAFMSVWPSANEKATDFGGKVEVEGSMKAVIGQVNMQSFGKETTQDLREVMKLAWFIGESVRNRRLDTDIPVLAVFVSSRKAQTNDRMDSLVHAFRVAMSGAFTEKEAEKAAKTHHGKRKNEKVTIDQVISYLITQDVTDDFDFEYVGRSKDKSDPGATTELSSLLPAGVFAGWD